MPRIKQSEPRKALAKNLERAGFFLSISKSVGSPLNRTKEYKELSRASLVFSIGAFDAYLSEITAEVLVNGLRNGTGIVANSTRARNALQSVTKALPTLALELALKSDEAERTALARSVIVEHFHTSVSNHGKKAVDATIEIVDPHRNIKGYWDAVATDERCENIIRDVKNRIASDRSARSGRTNSPAREFPEEMGASQLFEYWTDRRHRIVHQGENLGVWQEEATSCAALIALLGDRIDRLAQT